MLLREEVPRLYDTGSLDCLGTSRSCWNILFDCWIQP